MNPKPCISFHIVKDRDVTIEAKSHGRNWWIEINIGNTEITLYAASEADFQALCHRFSVITEAEAEAHFQECATDEEAESDLLWSRP